MVDVFENTEKQAIWHGSATKRLSGDDATIELIDEAVTALLAELVEAQARNFLDYHSSQEIARLIVRPLHAGCRDNILFRERGDDLFGRLRDHDVGSEPEIRQAGGVGHDVTNGNLVPFLGEIGKKINELVAE